MKLNKAISPILATVILIAVTLIIAIAVIGLDNGGLGIARSTVGEPLRSQRSNKMRKWSLFTT